MAAKLQLWLLSVLLLVCFHIPYSFCQSDSTVNIETFYPLPIPSPENTNDTRIFPPPPSPLTSPPPLPPPLAPVPVATQDSTSNRTVAKAVAATAAGTFVVSAVLFFLIRAVRRQRDTGSGGNQAVDSGGGDEFRRIDGNVKGLIVDENGLDVLYWKRLEMDDQRNSGFQKSVFHGPKHGGEEKEEIIHVLTREIPLIRGRSSSSSCNKVAPEVDDGHRIIASSVEIAIQDIQKPPLPTVPSKSMPPPPPPAPSKSMPPPPPPAPSKSMMSVPKRPSAPPPSVPSKSEMMSAPKNQNAPPPPPLPPPPLPAKKNQAPPPPAPKAISSKQPMVVLKALQSESKLGESSSRQGMAGSGNDQVKLKPLYWDKLKPNGDRSMVWDKIDNGSFR